MPGGQERTLWEGAFGRDLKEGGGGEPREHLREGEPGRGHSLGKGPEAGMCWCVPSFRAGPEWSPLREGKEAGSEVREGMGPDRSEPWEGLQPCLGCGGAHGRSEPRRVMI